MSDDPIERCELCGEALQGRAAPIGGRKICAACRAAVRAELAEESAPGSLSPPVAAGIAAAVAAGALWAALIATSGREIGVVAFGLGWFVAQVVRLAARGRRGPALQKIAAGCALLGLLLGKYFFVAHSLRAIARSPAEAAAGPGGGYYFYLLRALRAAAESAHAAPAGAPPGYLDLGTFRLFAAFLPRMLTVYDALWLFLALSVAWRALAPSRVELPDD